MNLPLRQAAFRLVYLGFLAVAGIGAVKALEASKPTSSSLLGVPKNQLTSQNAVSPTFSKRDFSPDTPHVLVGSYYTVENGFKAKLLLNNKGAEPLEVRPKLFSLAGQSVEIEPVMVDAQSARFIDLQDWVDVAGVEFSSGSIELFHIGLDLVLGAQIYLTDEQDSLSFEEKLAEMGKFSSQRQEAIWFRPSDQTETKIVISNKSPMPLTVSGNLSKAPMRVGNTNTFQLSAYQTKILDLENDFSDGNQFSNAEVAGLSLEHTGSPDALQARVFVYDRGRGYSNLAQFSNPNGGKSSEYHGVGFQIEDIEGIKLDPIIVVRNVGDQTSTVTAKVPYTRTDGTLGNITFPVEALKPREVKRLSGQRIVQRAAQESIVAASLELEYSTAPGSVIVSAHTQTADRDLIFRVPMWDPFAQKSPTGGYPWRIEGTSTTKTFIKNITDREQYYVAYLNWENGGQYMIGMKAIAPHQTIEIDVKKLRDERTPDEHGILIPEDATRGQFKWSLKRTMESAPEDLARDMLALIGRTEQIDLANGVSSNYACQNWCTNNYYDSYVSPSSSEIEVGQQATFVAFQRDADSYGSPGPYYQHIGIVHGWIYWSSSQTTTATLSGNTATAVGAGTTTITASWLDYQQPLGGTYCDPNYVTTPEESGHLNSNIPTPQPLSPPPPCEACTANPVWPHPSVVLTVKPTVDITQIKAVGKNETTSVRVIVSNNPQNIPITLTLSPISQETGSAQFTSTDASSRQISQTTNVEIKGIAESSAKRSMRLEAKYTQNNQIVTLKTMDFTVISVSLSLKFLTTDSVSSDNSARANYISTFGTSSLGGPRPRPGITGHWNNAIEIAATILPSDFDEPLTLQRVFNQQTHGNQTLLKTYLACPDTSSDFMLDKDPQSNGSQGKVYDLDAPGMSISDAQAPGVIARSRTNFTQWVSVSQPYAETTQMVRVSGNIFWFERLSIVKNTGSGTSLLNDVSNDNILGTGSTNLAWNLAGAPGLPPPSDPCPSN